MIRPFTCVCVVLAAGSGLYLYHAKYRAEVLDRQIAEVVKATDAAHERTGMLRAEWTVLNEPDRLQDLATRYLQLQPMAPTQFVQMSALDTRLPPVSITPPAPPAPAPAAPGPAVAATTPVLPPSTVSAPLAASVQMASAEVPTGVSASPVSASPVSGPTVLGTGAPGPDAMRRGPATAETTASATPAPHPREAAPARAASRDTRRHPTATAASGPLPGPSAEPRPLPTHGVMAPVVEAFATPHPMQINRAPSFQRAEATMPLQRAEATTPVVSSLAYSAPVGSALGGGRSMLPPPVPIQQ